MIFEDVEEAGNDVNKRLAGPKFVAFDRQQNFKYVYCNDVRFGKNLETFNTDLLQI